jgi:hypothetical protein
VNLHLPSLASPSPLLSFRTTALLSQKPAAPLRRDKDQMSRLFQVLHPRAVNRR